MYSFTSMYFFQLEMIHLKNMITIHPCNVIQVEGSHPSTWKRLHECNVFTSFKCLAAILHREVENCLNLNYQWYLENSNMIIFWLTSWVPLWWQIFFKLFHFFPCYFEFSPLCTPKWWGSDFSSKLQLPKMPGKF